MNVPDYVFEILLQDAWNLEPDEPLHNWQSITFATADRSFLRNAISHLYREVDFMVVRPEPDLYPDQYEIYRLKSELNIYSEDRKP